MPSGANLIVAATVPHFLPEYVPQPLQFDVDRHAPPQGEHRLAAAFAPFGIGPHLSTAIWNLHVEA